MSRPTHQGRLEQAFAGQVGNPACGDLLTVYLDIDTGIVRRASFESLGSPYQLATASVLCECVEGQTVEAAGRRAPTCVLERLPDLPQRNRYLARLAVEALHLALAAARGGRQEEAGRRDLVDEAQAEAFVLALLDGTPRATADVEAAARDAGILFPASAARTLSDLRAAGKLQAAIASDRRSWIWWATGAT